VRGSCEAVGSDLTLEEHIALAAQLGPIFELYGINGHGCACGNRACEHPGKHPRKSGWQTIATTDQRLMGRFHADSNIGLVTGGGFFVVDVDPRNAGDETLADLERKHGQLPETVRARTGGGGSHIFFRMPPGVSIRCRSPVSDLTPGIDLKAIGGFIVAPGSRHISGGEYVFEAGYGPDEIEVAEPPPWLLATVTANAKRTAKSPEAVIPQGQRNNRLASLGGSLRRKGMTVEEIRAALQVVNKNRCQPPLPDAELAKIAGSVGRYEPDEALGIPLTVNPVTALQPPRTKEFRWKIHWLRWRGPCYARGTGGCYSLPSSRTWPPRPGYSRCTPARCRCIFFSSAPRA
jgi:putative DNA primase/helicase